ncbi:MAG: tyrosine-type recombinase/integrase [Syntrophobacteraceae bacterium]
MLDSCQIRDKAGLRTSIRPHDLRHTFASRLASRFFTLQNLLEHQTTAMTKHYAHLLDDALKRNCVADRVSN